MNFAYFMPTKVFMGREAVINNREVFTDYGKNAYIMTAKDVAELSGSLADLERIFEREGISYTLSPDVPENPATEFIDEAVALLAGKKIDFVIGLGGGSPIDAAKAVSVLLKNPGMQAGDLFTAGKLEALPVIAIPTTAGTGSEVTQYAILTDHKEQTKRNFAQNIFPEVAILDPRYLMSLPDGVTINTAVDALTHLVEGYLGTKANTVSDALAEKGMELFSECWEALRNKEFGIDVREKLLLASALGGMVIAQSGTSLPHGMGYALTYHKNLAHGKANGILLAEYLNICEEKKRDKVLQLLGFTSTAELKAMLVSLLGEVEISEQEVTNFAAEMYANKDKLANHPYPVNEGEIRGIYAESLTLK